MARPKTLSDHDVLAAALNLMRERGPEAATFAAVAVACGLSSATLVQRFGSKARLVQRAILLAWDRLDEKTARLAAEVPKTPDGAIELLVGLSSDYGNIESYADGLLMLREDLRDPVLRARGAAWGRTLRAALDDCFRATPATPPAIGQLLAACWQGALLWWSFDPVEPVEAYVESSLRRLTGALV